MTTTQAPDLEAVLGAIEWARTRYGIASSAKRGSTEWDTAIEDLRRASIEARDLLERYPGSVSDLARVALRVAELGLTRLTRSR